MILNLWETISKIPEEFKNWIVSNGRNPILWTGLFLIGLVVFGITYRALNKTK